MCSHVHTLHCRHTPAYAHAGRHTPAGKYLYRCILSCVIGTLSVQSHAYPSLPAHAGIYSCRRIVAHLERTPACLCLQNNVRRRTHMPAGKYSCRCILAHMERAPTYFVLYVLDAPCAIGYTVCEIACIPIIASTSRHILMPAYSCPHDRCTLCHRLPCRCSRMHTLHCQHAPAYIYASISLPTWSVRLRTCSHTCSAHPMP